MSASRPPSARIIGRSIVREIEDTRHILLKENRTQATLKKQIVALQCKDSDLTIPRLKRQDGQPEQPAITFEDIIKTSRYTLPEWARIRITKWMREHDVVHKDKFGENPVRTRSAFDTLYYDIIKIPRRSDVPERYERPGFAEFCELVKMKIDDRVRNHGLELARGNYYEIRKIAGREIRDWAPHTIEWLQEEWDGSLDPPSAGNDRHFTAIDEILSLIEKDVRTWHDVELAGFFQRTIGIFVKQFNIPTIGQATNKAIQQEVDRFLGPSTKPFCYVPSGFLPKSADRRRRSENADYSPAKRRRTRVTTSKAADDSGNTIAGRAWHGTSPTPYDSTQGGYISDLSSSYLDHDEPSPQHDTAKTFARSDPGSMSVSFSNGEALSEVGKVHNSALGSEPNDLEG
ncbi:hypothetical protein MMC09_005532 [Bachmanniomyces sp. S44760]|nr:hypothetical protein [Bachmanniomyces sp. S44760]